MVQKAFFMVVGFICAIKIVQYYWDHLQHKSEVEKDKEYFSKYGRRRPKPIRKF